MARVRKQKGAKELLYSYAPIVVLQPEQQKGHWQEIFAKKQPIKLEIGMGRGTFLREMAIKHPDINFLGMEVVEEVINEAIERMQRQGGVPENLHMIWYNAENIEEIFDQGEIQGIYLNFSDPWPKYRHRKRRLTHERFLRQYEHILDAQGEIHMKTDSLVMFEFSLNEFARMDWKLKNISLDLYRKLPEDNVATEYEQKFVKLGMPIYRLEAGKI